MLLVKTSRQAKVSKFNVAFTIEEDVIRFDVTAYIEIS